MDVSIGSGPAPTGVDAGRRARVARLRRMKVVATGLLLAMAAVFVVSHLWVDRHPALGYVRAAAEAGMVGALADWFAVTALFRRPLRLPIPHTAIIERRKDAIASALGDFVAENFLSDRVVRERLAEVEIAARIGRYLAEPARAEAVAEQAASALRALTDVLAADEVAAALAEVGAGALRRAEVGPPLGRALAAIVERGDHRPVVDVAIDRAYRWILAHEQAIEMIVAARAPGWSPRFVDRAVGRRIYDEILSFALVVRGDPDHPLRRGVDAFLARLAVDLQQDERLGERVRRAVADLAGAPQLRHLVAGAWAIVQGDVIDGSTEPDSAARRAIARALTGFGRRLDTDAALAGRIDAALVDGAARIAGRHGRTMAGIIDETIARWDGRNTARTIEEHIGRDLQFIRINGTVVGAMAGLGIHVLAQWML